VRISRAKNRDLRRPRDRDRPQRRSGARRLRMAQSGDRDQSRYRASPALARARNGSRRTCPRRPGRTRRVARASQAQRTAGPRRTSAHAL